MNADTRRSTRAVDSPDRPSTILRKQPGAASPNASTRQSVRYPNAAAAAAASRYSRSSVRASVRQPGQSGLSGLSGHLDREVRVQVLDEEGRDRTPKPLLAARPHAGSNLAAEGPGSGGWGGDSPEPTSLFASSDRHSLHGHPHGPPLPSPAGFAWVDAPAEAGLPQPLRRPSQVLRPAQAGSTDSSANTDTACAPQVSGTVKAAPMQRAKATQYDPAPTASRGCQVLPWELARAVTAAEAAQQAEAAAEADTTPNGSGGTGAQEQETAAPQPEDVAEQKAMQALQGAALQQESSLAAAGGRDSRLRSDVHADRGSRAGCSSRASLAPHDQSRRTSCASVREGGDSSKRASMMSRASMAAYSGWEGLQAGRPSYMGSGPSLSGRSSAMASGYRQHASSMSGAEAAAEAARRQKAEVQHATARLPGIHPALHRVERLLAQNAFHPVVSKCKQVQPGGASVAGGESEAAAAAGAAGAAGEAVVAAGVEAGGAVGAGAGAGGAAGAGEGEATGAGSVGSVASVASAEPQELWQWRCEAAEELPVSCVAWNKASPDLLAVGYGQLDYSVAARGVVAFFSLTNPAHPVWHLSTPCGVSSLDFSRRAGGQLAVGMFDGSVAVYDVRGRSAVPANRAPPTTPDGSGGHAEPVWSIRYVGGGTSEGKSSGGEELLVSVSTDGRVLSWKHTQSLDCANLVRLKRQAGGAAQVKQGGQGAQTDGLLGRQAGGTCFDFSPADPRTYLVGTEEGQVHKCSTAFTEQYIQTYAGHAAPVYQVRWCPFRPSVFLTASADWTMRLWLESRRGSLWTFQQTHFKSEVNDVQWCPHNSTVFAAAAGNSLQVWDLEQSLLKPRASLTRYGVRLTAVCFNPTAPVLVCGADDGSVVVYSCAGLYREGASVEEESRRLEGVLRALVEQHLVQ